MAVCAGKFPVACQKRCVEGFGEGDIGRIVGRQGVAKLPEAWDQILVAVSLYTQAVEVGERFLRPTDRHGLAVGQTTQGLGHFHIDEMRRVQALLWGKRLLAHPHALLSLQQEFQYR